MSALKELFPDVAVIRRTGVINAWRRPAFRMAIEATGRKKLIIAAISDLPAFLGQGTLFREYSGKIFGFNNYSNVFCFLLLKRRFFCLRIFSVCC
jgi:hypothetical protein